MEDVTLVNNATRCLNATRHDVAVRRVKVRPHGQQFSRTILYNKVVRHLDHIATIDPQ